MDACGTCKANPGPHCRLPRKSFDYNTKEVVVAAPSRAFGGQLFHPLQQHPPVIPPTGHPSYPVSPSPASHEVIFGRQPVLAALTTGRALRRVIIARGAHGPAIDEIFERAREGRVLYDLRDRQEVDRAAGPGRVHQGVVALLAARAYVDYAELLQGLDAQRAFLVFLDGIQDPHNLGAIIRSAHAVGANGLVFPARGAAGLTSAAVKASAGAADFLPVCQVGNLSRALGQARDAGLWITGLVPEAGRDFTEGDFTGPVALVVGSEGKGMRRLVRAACDVEVCIPMARAEIGSLNASVAAALALYEVFRQRREAPASPSGGGS